MTVLKFVTGVCPRVMRLLFVLTLALLCCRLVAGDMNEPDLCKEETHCECLDSTPLYLVDCSSNALEEVPMTKNESYAFAFMVMFDDNRITRIPLLPSYEEVQKLSFKDNRIATIEDQAFAALKNLKELDLSYNDLTTSSLLPDVFKGFRDKEDGHDPLHLDTLDLSHNKLEALDSHAFQHLGRLKTLVITDNKFFDFSRDTSVAFNDLRALETLDLSRNGLKRIPDQFLAGLRELRKLVLEGNRFVSVPDEVNYGRSLHSLNLDNNLIEVVSENAHSYFHGPSSLKELSLSNMPTLTKIGVGAFAGLTNLTVLRVTNNSQLEVLDRLSFLGSSETSGNLKEVYLQENFLHTLADDLLPWNQLEKLDLQHNPWTCDCRMNWLLKGVLPTMIMTQPKLTHFINCAYPLEVRGINMKKLISDDYEMQCLPDSYNNYSPSSTNYGPLILATIFIGTLLLLTATVLCTYVLYYKYKESGMSSRTVHYRRAQQVQPDLESIAQNIDT